MTPFLCIATLSLYISYIKRFAVYVPLTLLVLCQFMCMCVAVCVGINWGRMKLRRRLLRYSMLLVAVQSQLPFWEYQA